MTKNIESIYPLSPTQEGILFHILREPDAAFYHNQTVCLLEGTLDITTFQQAWQQTVNQHSVLRTLFTWEGREKPLQIVRRHVEIPWQIEDWRSQSAAEQTENFTTWLAADQAQGFTITQAPLMRCALLRLTDATYRFVWSFHHILLDGWSTGIIWQQVYQAYTAFCQGETFVPQASRAYRDYIVWLSKRSQQQSAEFWSNMLADFVAPQRLSSLLGDKSGNKGHVLIKRGISAKKSTQISQFARENRLTTNNIIQGVWAILLSKLTRSNDIVHGATMSGRTPDMAGIEAMVGLFINSVPVRTAINGAESVGQFLQRLQLSLAEVGEHQNFPLVQIQETSGIGHDDSLFESLVVFENMPAKPDDFLNGTDLSMSNLNYIERSNFPLAFIILPTTRLQFHIIFDSSRFASEQITKLFDYFFTLLDGVLTNPTGLVSDLNMLSGAEEQNITCLWRATEVRNETDITIHSLIEQQAQTQPDNIAVVCENQRLTYRELNEQATELAAVLQREGAAPGQRIGIAVARSSKLMVAMLGVLKTGAAYVPLDANYPAERIQFVIDDAQLSRVIVCDRSSAILPEIEAKTVNIDHIAKTQTFTPPNISPDDAAYLIYTSGSTGKPKGVVISHRNLVHSTTVRPFVYANAVERFLLLSSFSFDSSVVGIYWSLCTGGTLVLPPVDAEKDAELLARLIEKHAITHLLCLPSLYQILLDGAAPGQLQLLNTVIVAGEACPPSLPGEHFGRIPHARLYNEYGPTEGTVWSTVHEFAPNEDLLTPVPIGKPIPNMQVDIVDQFGQPTPVGIGGELVIYGEGVAQGYWQRPNHPAFADGGYKTGDLARWLPNGTIQYLGRIDHQVKVRGHRIELGEIEAALLDCSGVEAAVVVAKAIDQLAAYVVCDGDSTAILRNAKADLAEALPAYMVPTFFVPLDSLPLTPNGKVDRNALPEPEIGQLNNAFEPPQSETEKILAEVWQMLLGVDGIGRNHNFFELGGHSLLVTRLVSKARQKFDINLSINAPFEAPTLAELATHIDTLVWASQEAVLEGEREEFEL